MYRPMPISVPIAAARRHLDRDPIPVRVSTFALAAIYAALLANAITLDEADDLVIVSRVRIPKIVCAGCACRPCLCSEE